MIFVSFVLFFKNYIWLNKIIMKHSSQKSDLESLFTQAEPWEPWESKLVIGSIIIALISLSALAVLINHFILK